MAEFGTTIIGSVMLNETRFDNLSVSNNLSIPRVEDISNPPPGFSFVRGGIYFDGASGKLYVSGDGGTLEEVSSAIPGGGGGTIEGAQNTAGGTGVFDTIVNGGITLQMRSIADTNTVTAGITGDNITLDVEGSPALQIGGVNYTVPTTTTDGQVLTWDNTTPGLEWITPTGGSGGTITGAVNTSSGPGVTGLFDSIVGGDTLQFKSLVDTDTISTSVNVGGNAEIEVTSSPALRFDSANFTVPSGPTDGQVLTYTTTPSNSLEWRTPSTGGTIPFPHEEDHFIDTSGGVGNEKTLQFSLGSMDNGDNIVLDLPTSINGTQVMVFRDHPQELTQKTLQSTTNVVAANRLYIDPTTPISMPTTGPTDGQVLTYTTTPSASLTWSSGSDNPNLSDILDVNFITSLPIDFGNPPATLVLDVQTSCISDTNGNPPGDGDTVLVRSQSSSARDRHGVYTLDVTNETFTRVPNSVFSGKIYNITDSAIDQRAYFVEGTGDINIDVDDIFISPYKGLLKSEIDFGHASYISGFTSETVDSADQRILYFVPPGGISPTFSKNINLISIGPPDLEYSYFQNISGKDRVWSISCGAFANAVTGSMTNLELYINVTAAPPTFHLDVPAGGTLTSPELQYVGYNSKKNSGSATEFITSNTTVFVPAGYYVYGVINAVVSGPGTWRLTTSLDKLNYFTITELSNGN